MDVKLNPVRCGQCDGTGRTPTLEPCERCNGIGHTYEMKVDAVNLLKLVTPTVKGTATSRPPINHREDKDEADEEK
jgi:DnaJ-class molecular chaperone